VKYGLQVGNGYFAPSSDATKVAAYISKVEKAVGSKLTFRETAIVGSFWLGKKGFRTAARDILKWRQNAS
jgi:hypothetical protein